MKITDRKKLIIEITAAAAAAIVLGFIIYKQVSLAGRLDARRTADDLVSQGRYIEAASIYSQSGYTELEAEAMALEKQAEYKMAKTQMDGGEFTLAKSGFLALGNYLDSPELAEQCDYLLARRYIADGDSESALDILDLIPEYPGSTEAITLAKQNLYAQAQEQAAMFDIAEAGRLFERLGDYEDSRALRQCCERVGKIDTSKKLLTKERIKFEDENNICYELEEGYLVTPRKCDSKTRFLLYYPGGIDNPVSLDFVVDYFLHPSPNTMVFFAYSNSLYDFHPRNTLSVNTFERLAAERGVFIHRLSIAGSSNGVYVALHAVRYCWEDFGIRIDCAMLYDCGSDWLEAELTMNEEQCLEAAQIGTQFLLFEGVDIGMNREAIVRLVEAGNNVTVVVCLNDDHEGITSDALSLGIVDWALGDRAEWFEHSNYRFVPLYPGSKYPNDESNPYFQYQYFE